MTLHTSVGIIGAGPAGLLLAHLLHRAGVESVVLENRSRSYIERRVRAGVLEPGAAQLLRDAGVGERLDREGLEHGGIHLRFAGESHHIDFKELTGRGIFVYGQQEVVKDLVEARLDAGAPIMFEAETLEIRDVDEDRPSILFRHRGNEELLQCDYVAACDGSHGIGRAAMLARGAVTYERNYPHAWLGILAATPPAADELIYAYHERGFALYSMRSSEVSRLYIQVPVHEQLDRWPDERILEELQLRLATEGWSVNEGEVFDKGITPMRSLPILIPGNHSQCKVPVLHGSFRRSCQSEAAASTLCNHRGLVGAVPSGRQLRFGTQSHDMPTDHTPGGPAGGDGARDVRGLPLPRARANRPPPSSIT